MSIFLIICNFLSRTHTQYLKLNIKYNLCIVKINLLHAKLYYIKAILKNHCNGLNLFLLYNLDIFFGYLGYFGKQE